MLRRFYKNLKTGRNIQRNMPTRRRMQFETLEPRILLSADLGIEAARHVPPTEVLEGQHSGLNPGQPPEAQAVGADSPSVVAAPGTAPVQLILVDSGVQDRQALLAQIPRQEGINYEIFTLDSTTDGIAQVTDILNRKSEISAIHILSHGASGQLSLGATSLDADSIPEHSEALKQWGHALNKDGDILLYGCNIAAGEKGTDFIKSLADATGSDVAASDDATGSAALGGDWRLEGSTGTIEAASLFGGSTYAYRLADVMVDGTASPDAITVDLASLTIAGGATAPPFFSGDRLFIDGMGGTDLLALYGTSGDDLFTIDGINHLITINGSTVLDYRGFETFSIDGGSGNDRILLTSGISFTGGVSFTAESIDIKADIYTGTGNLTLTALAVDNGTLSHAQAHINIQNAVLDGAGIFLTAGASVTATSAGLLNIPGAEVALITADSVADIVIGGNSQLISTGDVVLTAASVVDTTAKALANTSQIATAVDAAVATSIVDSTAVVHIGGTTTLSVGGALVMGATNTRTVTTVADGSAGGAGGSVAVAVVTGKTSAFLDGSAAILAADSISLNASKLDNIKTEAKAATGGASKSAGSPTTAESRLTEYKAETSAGSIGFAAAVAVTDVHDSRTAAYLASNQSITTAGLLTISSFDNADASTLADGSAVGAGSVGVGAAVAINLADVSNEAYIGGTGVISAGSLAIKAGLTPEADENPLAQNFSAQAISGASATMATIAGSLALNIADARSVATIKSGAAVTLTGGGDALLRAENTTVSTAIAKPVGEGAVAGTVGVGASVALNIANTLTVAELENNALLTGAHDLRLNATSDNTVTTIAKAGGKAGAGVGLGGALATSLANNETRTSLGTGPLQTLSGDFAAIAAHVGSTTTFADGSAGGDSAAIGIALGLNVVNDSTLATTYRNLNAAGDITFAAHAAAASSAGAKASAAGAEDEGAAPDNKGVDKKIGAERGLADKKATETGTKGTGATATPEAETSNGGISVAAAVGVNLASSTALAALPDNSTVTSGGLLTLSASNNSDATAKANGMATGAGAANVGAAVAINLVSAKNQALTGDGSTINAQWLTLEAKRTEVKGDTTGAVGAEAISGASGGKVGLAGSLALNLADSKNEAIIGAGTTVTLNGGDVKLVAEGATAATVLATAKGSAVDLASPEKVVAAGDTALITLDTKIGTAAGELNLTPAGAGTSDLLCSLRNGNSFVVVLNGALTVRDVIAKINTAGNNNGKLVASFDQAKQQIVLTDTTTVTPAISAATSVTQTGSPVFYKRNGGTAVAVPFQKTSATLNFALQVGTLSERVFVTVASKDYDNGSTFDQTKTAWLADIKEAIRLAMVDAGQLKATDAAVVDLKFIGGQLIFDSAKTLTIWTDTKASSAKQFKVETVGAATALNQLGLAVTTANTEGTVLTGSKLVAVAPASPAATENLIGGLAENSTYYLIVTGNKVKLATTAANATAGTSIDLTAQGVGSVHNLGAKSFTSAAVDITANTIDLGTGHGLTTGTAVVYKAGSGGTSSGSLGIGASVALNIANMTALAEVENNAVVNGANNISLSALSITKASTSSTAGGEAGGGKGVGIGGAISITVANNDTRAVIGSGTPLTLAGNFSAAATHNGTTATLADGAASGGAAAVGIALGLNVALDDTLATTSRQITAGGDVTFLASTISKSSSNAKASAAGAKGEEPPAADGSGGTPKNGVDQQVGAQRGLADKKANAAGTKNTGTTETKKAETSDGGVSVAGAVGVNLALSEAKAFIPDSGKITAGGTLTLRTSENTDASARGDGSAVDGTSAVGVGVGVGINFAMMTNSAAIGANAVINAGGVVIDAGMAGVDKAFALNAVYNDRNSVKLGDNHGLRTGDAVVYDSGGGGSIGGLASGQTYYVVADDTRTFNARPNGIEDLVGSDLPSPVPGDLFGSLGNVSYKDNWIDLGGNHLLKDGDLVIYSKASLLNLSSIGGLIDGATYIVDVVEASPTRIKLLDAKTKAVVDLTFVTDPQKFNYLFDHKFTIVKPTAVKLALTAEAAFRGETIDLDKTGASGTAQRLLDVSHRFDAEGFAGASAGNVGVAGALGLNVVLNTTEAVIKGGATVTAGSGDILISAANAEVDGASAIAKVSGSGKVGVGASAALNVLPVHTTRAEIEDGAVISGGHDLTLRSISDHSVTTYVAAGSAGGTAVSPAVGIALVINDTTARIGTLAGSTMAVTGNVTIEASHTGTVVLDANATAAGEKVAVGAVLGVNIVIDKTTATLQRNLNATGAVSIAAHTFDTSVIEVTASAKGNKGADEGGKSADAETDSQVNGTTGSGGKALPKAQEKLDSGDAKANAKTGGSGSSGAGVAASIGVNFITSETTATIADGMKLTAGGALSVTAESETDMTTKALGAAINPDSKVGVGAAVAMNVAVLNNRAAIGASANVAADGITVKAGTPTGRSNDFTAWALAIGGGKDYGVAGSAAINAISSASEATIGAGAYLRSSGGIEIKATDAIAYQNIAGGGGVGKSAGVGLAVSLNLISQSAKALIGNTVHADAREAIAIKAKTSIAPLKLSVPGSLTPDPEISSVAAGGGVSSDSTSKVAIGGSAIVDVIIQDTQAAIGDGALINATTGFTPGANQSVAIEAESATRIVNGAGGLAISCGNTGVGIGIVVGVVVKDTKASIGSGATVKADKNVVINATATEDILSLASSAGVSKENGVGGALALLALTSSTRAAVEGATGKTTTVQAGGNVSITASDTSSLNTLAFTVAAAGKNAVGAAGSLNLILNKVAAEITGSTVIAGGNVALAATSSPIIRALGIGASGAGDNAVSVALLGNSVANTVTAFITGGSTVRAGGDVTLSAKDQAANILPSWMLPADKQAELDTLLAESPIKLQSSILALNISVAGSGKNAVSVGFTGNVVTNTVKADIINSIVLAGVNATTLAIENSSADIYLSALADAGIISLSVGVGASGKVAFAATGFGNVITNTTDASISGVSTVRSGGLLSVKATDQSQISSVGLSIAASGSAAISAVIGANVITNKVHTLISDSTVSSGSTLDLAAISNPEIYSFSGGLAFSISGGGTAVAAGAALAVNIIANSITSAITNATVTAKDTVTIKAEDTAIIAALTIAGAASGSAGGSAVAIGVSLAYNMIDNDLAAYVLGSQVTSTTGSIGVHATENSRINAVSAAASVSVGIGSGVAVSGAGAAAINTILTKANAFAQNSVLSAADAVVITARSLSAAPALNSLTAAMVGGAAAFASKLDDAAATDEDNTQTAAVDERTDDITADNLFRTEISGILTANGIINSGSLAVTSRTQGSEWSITDRITGSTYVISKNGSNFDLSMPSISAVVVATSAAVSAGGNAGVSIGVSFAANYIGWELGGDDTLYSPRYTTANEPARLEKGDRVKIEDGVKAGYIYEYIGKSADLYQYTTGDGTKALNKGDLVKLNAGYDNTKGAATTIYRYIGGAASVDLGTQNYTDKTLWESVGSSRLTTQDYGNTDLWRQVNLVGAPAEVQAYARNSSIVAGGAFTITANASQSIEALVVAGSAAVSAGSTGVAVSGAGAGAINHISTKVKSFIDGDGAAGIAAGTLTLTASDTSSINAITGAATLAAGFGGTGVAVSIGVAVAHNSISNDVSSFITGADTLVKTTTGALSVLATESSRITSITAAASLSAGFGSVGVAVSGAGAAATNTIQNRTNAYVSGSMLAATEAAGDVIISAIDTSKIDATVAALSAAVAGGSVGVGVSIGAAYAGNMIGYDLLLGIIPIKTPAQVRAYVDASTISAGGDVQLIATADETITSRVLAGSVAIAAGAVGVAVGGSGVLSINLLATDINAYISGSSTVTGKSVVLTADDKSRIMAFGGAAAISGGFGAVGVAVSIGVSLAHNMIDNNVAAYIKQSSVSATGASGIGINATERSQINAVSAAAALAVGIGAVGISVSGAGAEASNVVLTKTNAYTEDSMLTSAGNIAVTAQSLSAAPALNALTAAVIGDATAFANKLDDAAATDADNENTTGAGNNERDNDIIADNSFLSQLAGHLATQGILNSGSLAVTARTLGSVWSVTDRITGSSYVLTKVGGDFTVTMPTIGATVIAASAAVAGGAVGVGVSIGVSFATNLIGWAPNTSTASDYTTADAPTTLTKDTKVKVESGVHAGNVYQYRGVTQGPQSGQTTVNLKTQDYGNIDLWKQVNLDTAPAEVRAYLLNSSVNAIGGLTQTACSDQSIDALVVAGSAAASGGAVGVSVSGAGAGAVNTIATDVKAFIEGDKAIGGGETAGIKAGSVALRAEDTSRISAVTGAASLAAAFGAVGVGVSIGVAGAVNAISNEVAAYILNTDDGVKTTSGSIRIEAVEAATINALTAAASLAVTIGAVGVSVSGAGAGATNIIGNTAHAYVVDSILGSADAVVINASDTSTINAIVAAASAAVAGGAVGVGVSIGGSVAINLIGSTAAPAGVQAYVKNSTITATGDLIQTATANETIKAAVLANSMAIAPGAVGVAVSGTAVVAVNKITADIKSFIDQHSVINTGGVNLTADDTSTITAFTGAGSIAAAFGGVGVAVSLGIATGHNEITNNIAAYINDSTVTTLTGGSIEVHATEHSQINATA